MNRNFPDRRIPMRHGESIFKDPFFHKDFNFGDLQNDMGKVTEKHMEKTTTSSSSTQEEFHEEFHEKKVDDTGHLHHPVHPILRKPRWESHDEKIEEGRPFRRTRFETVYPSTSSTWTAHDQENKRSEIHEETHYQSSKPSTDTMSKIVCDPEQFQVLLEVEQYKPEELTVKTADHYVIVEGQHKELKQPRGYLTRQFTRKYLLPIDCKPENIKCQLSEDGLLVVSVPRESFGMAPLKEVLVEIQKTDKKMKEEPPKAAATAA